MLNSLLKTNKCSSIALLLGSLIFISNGLLANSELDFLLSKGIENSFELKRLQSESDAIDLNQRYTNSLFLPKFGIEARFESFKNNRENENGGTGHLFLDWNLLNGFRDYSARKSSKYSKAIKDFEMKRVRDGIELKIKHSYAQVLASQQNLQVLKKFLEKNQEFLKTVKLRRSSGLISESDQLEFELFESKLKFDFLNAEIEYGRAQKQLMLLTGLDKLPQLSKQLDVNSFDKTKINVKELLTNTQSQLKENDIKQEELTEQKKWSAFQYLPNVSFMASHGSLGIRETDNSPETMVGVFARWEFFSGFQTSVENKSIELKILQNSISKKEKERLALSELEELLIQLENLQNQIKFEESNSGRVERYLSLVSSEYRRGVKNAADVKAALETALLSSLTRTKLVVDHFANREKLHDVVGVDVLSF
jgi:outer membrane protein TolC